MLPLVGYCTQWWFIATDIFGGYEGYQELEMGSMSVGKDGDMKSGVLRDKKYVVKEHGD